MGTAFPHDLVIKLMNAVRDKKQTQAYDIILEVITSGQSEILITLLMKPEVKDLPQQMLKFYVEREEYEKCEVVKKLLDEINQSKIK